MPRLLFEKTGNAVWVSHLDLMRLFQRAFKRAGLSLTHTKGFNPRPSVSIALPLSVGIESRCELLDFELEGEIPSNEEIMSRLNDALVTGIRVLDVYEGERKIKHLKLLRAKICFEYDHGIPAGAAAAIRALFSGSSLILDKHSKNGITQQDIIPMIRSIEVAEQGMDALQLDTLICCQDPTLNPMQFAAAVERYLPDYRPDFVKYSRLEIYDAEEKIFR